MLVLNVPTAKGSLARGREYQPSGRVPTTPLSFEEYAVKLTQAQDLAREQRSELRQARLVKEMEAWGALFEDLDGDGWEDLAVPNGFVTGEDPDDL